MKLTTVVRRITFGLRKKTYRTMYVYFYLESLAGALPPPYVVLPKLKGT